MAEEKKVSAEELLSYLKDALTQRKAYMADVYAKTTNPLDRLSFKDRMEEIDVVLKYLEVK